MTLPTRPSGRAPAPLRSASGMSATRHKVSKLSWLERLFFKNKRVMKSRTIEQSYDTKRVFNWNTPFWLVMVGYIVFAVLFGDPGSTP